MEAALVRWAMSEELVTVMLFTITLVEGGTVGSGGTKAACELEVQVVTAGAVADVVVDTGSLVYDVSFSPQEELTSVKSVMAKETCAVKEQTFSDLATKNSTWPQKQKESALELVAERARRRGMNY